MNNNSFKSIRTRLTSWFLFLALIPLLIALVLTYFQRVQAIEEQTIDKLTAIRNLKVQQLTRWIDERSGDLKVISGDFETRELENIFEKKTKSPQDLDKIEEVREIFKRFHRNYNDYKELFFIDAHTGLIEISTNQEYVGTNKSHDLLFTEPLSTGDIFIKDIHRSSTTNQIEMTFSIPVFCMKHSTHIIGVLVLRIDLEHSLYDLLGNKVGLGETGESLIVNSDVVALNELRWYDNAPLNLIIDAEPAVRASQGKTGITETTDYRGKKILAAYTYIPQTKWGFVCKQDLSELHTPIRKMLINFVIIFLLSGIVISFFTLLQSKSISKPIIQMNKVAKKMQAGDYSIRNPITSKDELGSLAAAFNKMADATESRLDIQQYVTDISETMITQSSMQDFGSALLKTLMNITNANMCTFYILNEATSQYEHFSSIGANQELLRSFDAANPEGEFGNAVSEKKIIYLNNISEDTIFKYRTTAGDLIPKEIITIPVIIDNAVVALISLASIKKFKKDTYDVLQQSMIGISTSYSNLLASERTRILAEHLSQINQQLEAQTEELQEQSEEMQSQSEELQHTSEELQEQNLELEMQRKQVEEANRLKSEFLSNMSHELRTPLNSIMALSRVLIMQASNKLTEEENNYLEIVERNGKQLLSLINDILDLSKIEAGKMEVSPTLFSIDSMLKNISDSMLPLMKEKNLNFELDVPDGLPNINTDESKLGQILQNIISNAVKFTENGSIKISVENDTQNFKIIIKDTGIGIPQKALSHIFEEFRQVDGTPSRLHEGTGLGLAIASKLVKALFGEIYAESKLGIGTTFTVTIPLQWQGDSTHEEFESIMDNSRNFSNNSSLKDLEDIIQNSEEIVSNPCLLIVEDNEDSIIQMKSILQKENYIIDVARGGKEALEFVKHTVPDGIILDLMMPEVDGFEVLEKIRNTNATRDIPVLVLTAKDLTKKDLSKLGANNIQQIVQKGDVNITDLLYKIKLMFKRKALDRTKMLKKDPGDEAVLPNTLKDYQTKPVVLIVEDNPDSIVTIKAILGDNYEFIEACDGEAGIDKIETENPDLVLLDISLPKIDGFEVLNYVKRKKDLQNIPIIAVTARAMKKDKDDILAAGFDDYISKPINHELLFKAIKKQLVKELSE